MLPPPAAQVMVLWASACLHAQCGGLGPVRVCPRTPGRPRASPAHPSRHHIAPRSYRSPRHQVRAIPLGPLGCPAPADHPVRSNRPGSQCLHPTVRGSHSRPSPGCSLLVPSMWFGGFAYVLRAYPAVSPWRHGSPTRTLHTRHFLGHANPNPPGATVQVMTCAEDGVPLAYLRSPAWQP
jgi:hypothetical protein